MGLSWSQLIIELESRLDQEAVIQFEMKGAFLTFRSRLIRVERPAAFSPETMNRFGVVPHHVTLHFVNGVRINVYIKHIERMAREEDGMIVSFRTDGNQKCSLSLFPRERRRQGYAG